MEAAQNKSQAVVALSSAPTSSDRGQTGLLLCRDLIFTTKIKATAQALGFNINVVGDAQSARLAIEGTRPRVIFIDLMGGELATPQAISSYIKLANSDAW